MAYVAGHATVETLGRVGPGAAEVDVTAGVGTDGAGTAVVGTVVDAESLGADTANRRAD